MYGDTQLVPFNGTGVDPTMKSIVLSLLLAAVLPGVIQDQTGSIEGTITNAYTGDPIRDIQVSIDNEHRGTTDRSGHFRITKVPPGEHSLNVSQHDYILNPGGFTFGSSTDAGIMKLQPRQQIRDVQLEMVPSGTISGHIWNSDGSPVAIISTCVTAARNQQTIFNVPTGRYIPSGSDYRYRAGAGAAAGCPNPQFGTTQTVRL